MRQQELTFIHIHVCCVKGNIVRACCVKGNIVGACCVKNIVRACCVKGNIVRACCVKGNIVRASCVKGNIVRAWFRIHFSYNDIKRRKTLNTKSQGKFLQFAMQIMFLIKCIGSPTTCIVLWDIV
jgi:hypothetical protein